MYKIKVEDIHCMSCVQNIEDALKESDAQVKLEADIEGKMVKVESQLSLQEVKKVIEEAGYGVGESEEV